MSGTCGFGVPYVCVEPVGLVFPMCEWNPWVWCSLCVSGTCGFGVPYV